MGFLEQAVAAELAQWSGFQAIGLDEKKIAENLTRPPKADMGDLAFATFRFAKDAKKKPPELAAELVQTAPAGKPGERLVSEVKSTGPYVNLNLNQEAVTRKVLEKIEQESPGNEVEAWNYGNSKEGDGKTLVIDLSSPNIAKPLAVHHLRSTMIGYSIKKIRESQGWRVVGINHLGDWGTGFGKLIAGYKQLSGDPANKGLFAQSFSQGLQFDVKSLLKAYQHFNSQAQIDTELEEKARHEFAVLEKGVLQKSAADDHVKDNVSIWYRARTVSLAEFERVYEKLGLHFIDTYDNKIDFRSLREEDYRRDCFYIGESFYVGDKDLCGELITSAKNQGVAEKSEGALVVFTHGEKKPPVILLKSDGATSYHTRDMASALYRQQEFDFTDAAYVVGGEQKLHFKQLFKAMEMLGYDWAKNCSHVDFGLMLFKQEDGSWAKGSTRKGTAIMLEDLLDESVKAVREIIAEKNEELAADADETEKVASAVGVGAVVFNDLKNGRKNNVKFDWDAVLDFQGESGPYMQMQYVRMGSVMKKFEETYGQPALADACPKLLERDEEWKIILSLAQFPDVVAKASAEYEPSIVARHLIDLAGLTSSWWTATKDTRIVGDDEQLSLARVRLVNAIRKVLGKGLNLLAMQLVDRM